MEVSTLHGETDIILRPASIEEEVMQNVRYLLVCIREKNPLARGMGIDEIIDSPGIQSSGYEAKVIEVIEKWEPRFRVTEVLISYDEQGRWLASVRGELVGS